jgi:hypothetical protein
MAATGDARGAMRRTGVKPQERDLISMIEFAIIALSCFAIGFCATDFVCHRLRTGNWL